MSDSIEIITSQEDQAKANLSVQLSPRALSAALSPRYDFTWFISYLSPFFLFYLFIYYLFYLLLFFLFSFLPAGRWSFIL
jgi:hypothetical protein